MKTFLLAFALSLSAAAFAQSAPTAPGVYLQSNGQWIPLSIDTPSGVRTEGTGRAMFTGGLSRVSSNTIYSGSHAAASSASPSPVFCIVGASHAQTRDIVIVRTQQKHGHRELATASFGAYHGADLEYPERDTVHVSLSPSGACQIITPLSTLKPGEYLLFPGAAPSAPPIPGYNGYDFSVTP